MLFIVRVIKKMQIHYVGKNGRFLTSVQVEHSVTIVL